MNELQPLIDLLSGKFGWLPTVLGYIAAARLPLKFINARLQQKLTEMMLGIAGDAGPRDPDDVQWFGGLLRARWYRATAFTIDLVFSVKLPTHTDFVRLVADRITQQQPNKNMNTIRVIICAALLLPAVSSFAEDPVPQAGGPAPAASLLEKARDTVTLSYDTFATASWHNPGNEVDPSWGVGIGVNVFYEMGNRAAVGIAGELVTENTQYKVFDGANASLVFKYALGDRVEPYAFIGGGYLTEHNAWQGHAGGGFQINLTDHAAIFTDARWITSLDSASLDYPMARAGLRFKF